jgi:tape measure domain-containing protein
MADLSLKISANFEQAQKAFNDLAASSENFQKKIEKWSDGMKQAHVDDFIDRQNRLAVAMAAAGKQSEVITVQTKNYQREIQRLVDAGLTPESNEIQTLQGKLIELVANQKAATNAAVQAAEKEKEYAEALESMLTVAEKEADIAVKQLDVKKDLEKQNIHLKQSQEDIKDEIHTLISQGYQPESKEVEGLKEKYKNLTAEIETNEKALKMQQATVKGAQVALVALAAATAAVAGFAIKAAADTEDMIAAFTPLMGSTEKAAKLVNRIGIEAAATPFEIDKIAASVKNLMPAFNGSADEAMKAFNMIGDTAQGNSQKLETITNAYTKVMLKTKVSMEELNMIADAGVPIYTELAYSMGVSVSEMMKMSSEGKITSEDLTNVFKKMTDEGGIFYKGMETSSITFNSTLTGVKENIGLIAGTIGDKLLPSAKKVAEAAYNATRSFMEWISEGDNLKIALDVATYAVAGLAAGLTAFLVVSKGAAVIEIVTAAIQGLTGAMAANPFGAIAVVITAVLIPALIFAWKNWDMIVSYFLQGLGRIEYGFKWTGSIIKESFIVSINSIKISFMSLVDIIQKKVLGKTEELLDVMGKIPFVGELFQSASDAVRGFSEGITASIEVIKTESVAIIQAAHEEQDAMQETLDAKLAAIDASSNAVRAQLKKQQEENIEAEENITRAAVAAEQKRKEAVEDSLKKRLEALGQTEAQINSERMSQLKQFLLDRVNAEDVDGQARIEKMKEHTALILENANLEETERLALIAASNALQEEAETALTEKLNKEENKRLDEEKRIREEEEKLSAASIEMKRREVEIMSGLAGALSNITNALFGETIAGAIASRALAAAQAAINSYLAFTQVLADPFFVGRPFSRAAAAATILASGIAQQVNIIKTPLPSAETGGRFEVPDVGRVDGAIMRVNPGESVNIIPRGADEEDDMIHQVFMFDGSVLADMINKLARKGELYTLQLAGNL